MFKKSIFNFYTKVGNKTVVFNSFTEKLVVLENYYLDKEDNFEGYFFNSSEENKRRMIEYGLVVKEDADEIQIASVKYFDRISNDDLYLMILPTYSCNFRCKYCYENFDESYKSFPSISLSDNDQRNIVKFVENFLKDYHCLVIEWHGGEPLLEINKINNISAKFIDIASRFGKPFIATLTTNGYFLTENVVRQMLKNHVIKFHVTLDGFDWNHDKYRLSKEGNNTFNIILNNLLNIKNNIKQKNFTIIIRTNITNEFLPYLDEWLKFLSNNFSDDKRFQIYIKMVEDKGGVAVKSLKNELLYSEREMYKIMANSNYANNYGYYFSHVCNSICSASMRNKYIFAPRCAVKKCGHYLFDIRSDVGLLQENGYIKFDRSSFSKWITYKTPKNKCINCPLWASCFNSFCPLRSNFDSKNISVCSEEHKNIKEVINLLLSPYNTNNNAIYIK